MNLLIVIILGFNLLLAQDSFTFNYCNSQPEQHPRSQSMILLLSVSFFDIMAVAEYNLPHVHSDHNPLLRLSSYLT